MREFRSVQAWRSSRKLINICVCGAVRKLGSRFKRKPIWRSWHHDLESIRHDLESLCSDNDPRCHMRKIKTISLDWITLVHKSLFNLLSPPLFWCPSLNVPVTLFCRLAYKGRLIVIGYISGYQSEQGFKASGFGSTLAPRVSGFWRVYKITIID